MSLSTSRDNYRPPTYAPADYLVRLRAVLQRVAGRTDRGWQLAAARALDVPHQTVNRWVHDGGLSTQALIHLSLKSGVSLDWLLTGEGPVNRLRTVAPARGAA